MPGTRDMTVPNWKRSVNKARRLIAELREIDQDIQVIEPPNFETPPSRRIANTSHVE